MKTRTKRCWIPLILALLAAGAVRASEQQAPADVVDSPAPARQDACIRCHLELDADLDPAERMFDHFADGVHAQPGLGCVGCHGGNEQAFDDEDAAMWGDKSFRGAPKKSELPVFCGRCHSDPVFMRRYNPGAKTDQAEKYYTSQHGMLLKKGENRVAGCVDCHGVHGIYPVKNPLSSVYPTRVPGTCGKCHGDVDYMRGFDIPTTQLAEYTTSVHGVALLERHDTGSPACNDCHGNHGAIPPEVDAVANICGNCHVFDQRLFQESRLRVVFGDLHFPLCVVCHEKHAIAKATDDFLNWNDKSSVCKKCHEDGHAAQKMANTFFGIIDSLKVSIAVADSLIERAEMKGMEVSDLFAAMEDARRALIQSRTSVHAFDEKILRETADKGQKAAEASIVDALQLLEHFQFRQRGLFLATLIISFLVVVIWLKIRQIEAEKPR